MLNQDAYEANLKPGAVNGRWGKGIQHVLEITATPKGVEGRL